MAIGFVIGAGLGVLLFGAIVGFILRDEEDTTLAYFAVAPALAIGLAIGGIIGAIAAYFGRGYIFTSCVAGMVLLTVTGLGIPIGVSIGVTVLFGTVGIALVSVGLINGVRSFRAMTNDGCPSCGGSGIHKYRDISKPCNNCDGKGYISPT